MAGNTEIAKVFNEIADLLEIKGENRFRILAYRRAAEVIEDLPCSLKEFMKKKDLTELPGIGKDLSEKIKIILKTGSHPLLKKLRKEYPKELSSMMKLSNLGPKKIKKIYEKLKISTLKQLEAAVKKNKIKKLAGFGAKTEKNILEELGREKGYKHQTKINQAEQIITPLLQFTNKIQGLKKAEIVGSYRRQKETVGDLDILALVDKKKKKSFMDEFIKYEEIKKVVSKGSDRITVLLKSDVQVDLRAIVKNYGAGLIYFTGSKAHNIALRTMALKKQLKINEYGVFKGKKEIAGKTETSVYASLKLPYIEPELRENLGEIEAAKKKRLPKLITLEEIRGDLHAHTNRTDGHNTIKEMSEAAKKMGYKYLAITDHSQKMRIVNGLDEKELKKQIREIDALNSKLRGLTILKGIEVDILKDGKLDLPASILKELDLVIGAIHSSFKLSKEKQTERILRAMDQPYFNILAHPTGRLIKERAPYEVDLEKVMKAAKERGCILEINANPSRLDLKDVHCRLAKEIGVKMAISTDAHHLSDLDFIKYGVGQARRGWLEKKDVVNSDSLKELKKALKR